MRDVSSTFCTYTLQSATQDTCFLMSSCVLLSAVLESSSKRRVDLTAQLAAALTLDANHGVPTDAPAAERRCRFIRVQTCNPDALQVG